MKVFSIFFNWTEVFQSVGAHAGLCRTAVRELRAACTADIYIGDTATIVAEVSTLLDEYFSDYYDYDVNTATVESLRVFHGHRPSAIAEVCDPRALKSRLDATRGNANHKRLWNAYLFGTALASSTPEAGGLVAELYKALPRDAAVPARAVAAGAAAGIVDSSDEDGAAVRNSVFDRLKTEVDNWVREVKNSRVPTAPDVDVLRLVSEDSHRRTYPLLSIIQVRNHCFAHATAIFTHERFYFFKKMGVMQFFIKMSLLVLCSATTCLCVWDPTILSAWRPSWGM